MSVSVSVDPTKMGPASGDLVWTVDLSVRDAAVSGCVAEEEDGEVLNDVTCTSEDGRILIEARSNDQAALLFDFGRETPQGYEGEAFMQAAMLPGGGMQIGTATLERMETGEMEAAE
ncbi:MULTISPECIES: hypothetical protein [Pacificimonas]|nr:MULTISPECIES: hypothetical protein [Pacificimonas]MBZ6380015.1 hypothetical protein [Pacificimonas aurantium]